MKKYIYIAIHDMVSRVMSYIIGLDSQMDKYQFKNKIQSENWHGMDNSVTGLTIKQTQANYCNFDLYLSN